MRFCSKPHPEDPDSEAAPAPPEGDPDVPVDDHEVPAVGLMEGKEGGGPGFGLLLALLGFQPNACVLADDVGKMGMTWKW